MYSLVLDVFKPKPVGFSDPDELVHNYGGEQLPGAVLRLQHAANVQVDVVDAAVGLFQFLRQLRVTLEQLLVDVFERLDAGQFEIRSDLGNATIINYCLPLRLVVCDRVWRATESLSNYRVVIGQPVVPAPHDVQRAEVPPRELVGSEQFVTDVRAQHRVFTLGQLRGHAQHELFDAAV